MLQNFQGKKNEQLGHEEEMQEVGMLALATANLKC